MGNSNSRPRNLTTALASLNRDMSRYTTDQIQALRHEALKSCILTPSNPPALPSGCASPSLIPRVADLVAEGFSLIHRHGGAEADTAFDAAGENFEAQIRRLRRAREGIKAAMDDIKGAGDGAVAPCEAGENNIALLTRELEELLTNHRDWAHDLEWEAIHVAALEQELNGNVARLVDDAVDLIGSWGEDEQDAMFAALAKAFLQAGKAHAEAFAREKGEKSQKGSEVQGIGSGSGDEAAAPGREKISKALMSWMEGFF